MPQLTCLEFKTLRLFVYTHQGFSVFPDEIFSWCGPGRQQNICHWFLRNLQMSQVEAYNNHAAVTHKVLLLKKYLQINNVPTSHNKVKQINLLLKLSKGTVFLTVHVLQEFWKVKELWDELFDVSWTLHASLPGCCHRVELSVCTVKPKQQHVPIWDHKIPGNIMKYHALVSVPTCHSAAGYAELWMAPCGSCSAWLLLH